MEQLKPCPFCGNDAADLVSLFDEDEYELFLDDVKPHQMYKIICRETNGGCGTSIGYQGSKEKAIEAWNRRADND